MRKILLSGFIILSFAIYAINEQLAANKNLPAQTSTGPSRSQPPLATQSPPGLSFKDGAYTGSSIDAFYGNVQVRAVVGNGRITDIQFLDYPQDHQHSQEINSYAVPQLISEAIQVQSANVDIVSGATQTSLAFQKSLGSALNKAQQQ